MKRLAPLLAALAASVSLGACGGSDADLTVYSGRNEQLVGELITQFEKDSGLQVDVRYGDSAELAATIAEEGDNSPADVFFSQDAGALGTLEDRLSPVPAADLDRVPERFRSPAGRWVGVTGRARVLAFSTERMKEDDVPDTIFDLVKPEWKGRFGIAPPNASFQAFVSAMRIEIGDAKTREWLEGIKANGAKRYDNNIQQLEAIDRGEIDLGVVNHYYVYELSNERPDLPVRNHFLRDGDPGSLVNAAGVGVLSTTENDAAAQRFLRFLLSDEAQSYFSEHNGEYPLTGSVEPREDLPPLDSVHGPDISLADLGEKLRSTLEMLDEVGLTS